MDTKSSSTTYHCSKCGVRHKSYIGLHGGFWQTKRRRVCGNVTSYERMGGTTYCQCQLKIIETADPVPASSV